MMSNTDLKGAYAASTADPPKNQLATSAFGSWPSQLLGSEETRRHHLSEFSDHILRDVRAGAYEDAYRIGSEVLSKSREDADVMATMLELSAHLRSECMSLATKKIDYGQEYVSLENLLRKVNELTGQDMYGSFKTK